MASVEVSEFSAENSLPSVTCRPVKHQQKPPNLLRKMATEYMSKGWLAPVKSSIWAHGKPFLLGLKRRRNNSSAA
jgi:hypothetical protein